MARRALSATQVAALQREGTHWVDRNLALQIKPQGARSWLFRYERSGKTTWLGLGAARDVPLSRARGEADRLRVRMRDGVDPLGERAAAKNAAKPKARSPTFATCAGATLRRSAPAGRATSTPSNGPVPSASTSIRCSAGRRSTRSPSRMCSRCCSRSGPASRKRPPGSGAASRRSWAGPPP